MKFLIQRDKLLQGIQETIGAVNSKPTIPILGGLKITASQKGLVITGSDSDISIESSIPREEKGEVVVEIEETGSIVVQARFFSDIIKKLPLDIVKITKISTNQVRVESGKSEFLLNTLSADDYPQLPKINEGTSFSLPVEVFQEIIKQTAFAVSTSETRQVLTGVNFKFNDQELHCVATDSHRLSFKKVKIDKINANQIIIPGKSLIELSKILNSSKDKIEITLTKNQILFKVKNLLFYSRLLEGTYPETSRLIQIEDKFSITLSTQEILSSIERAYLLAREANNNVKLEVLNGNRVNISSFSPEIGKVEEEFQAIHIEGKIDEVQNVVDKSKEFSISFSAKYMLEALKTIDSDEIKIRFSGSVQPFIIQSKDDQDMLQLIQPIRTY